MTDTLARPISRTVTVREQLLAAINQAAWFNQQDLIRPLALLWPDEGAAWTGVVEDLRAKVTMITLGPYEPDVDRGPAEWLRMQAQISKTGADVSSGCPLVIYLPGISRKQLSDPTRLPEEYRALAFLAFRCAVFAHPNGGDWTPAGFFANAQEGLGVDVAHDGHTRGALGDALVALLDVPVAKLQGRHLAADDFNSLTIGDDVREILRWLNYGVDWEKQAKDAGRWNAFVELVKSNYKVNPQRDGLLAAGAKLGEGAGQWSMVWERFREAPGNYPAIPDLLRRSRPDGQVSFGFGNEELTWPQDNDDAEAALATALGELGQSPPNEIRAKVAELEKDHGPRRDSVWADLGMTALANALEKIADVGTLTEVYPTGDTVEELAQSYATGSWQTDRAFVDALASLPPGNTALSSVIAVAEALYRPWLQASSELFQQAWFIAPPTGARPAGISANEPSGTCALFVDGLRYDVASQLSTALTLRGLLTDCGWGIAGVPTVTSTCKPAVTPVAGAFGSGDELTPRAIANNAKYGQEVLRKELRAEGWHEFSATEVGTSSGRGWTEGGNIDKLGHSLGAKLVYQLPGEVIDLSNRITELLSAGWHRIVVITDHGWHLLPSKLPKADLPEHLTKPRKGRCARLADGISMPPGTKTLPWRWDSQVRIAIAPGIYAYEAGKAYEHGGISLQESVLPRLVVTSPEPRSVATQSGPLVDMQWVGLALRIQIAGLSGDIHADLRVHANEPGSSLLEYPKPLKEGKARLMVSDDNSGKDVVLVLLDSEGHTKAQRPTAIPEG